MNARAADADRRFPNFLIIGAMKSGTTTLYWDLAANAAISFPVDKEVNNLTSDAVLTPAGRDEYSNLFGRVKTSQICGDASTSYSMRPDFEGVPGRSEGVPSRARTVAGADLRILYIMRDPIERIVSHHYHNYRRGRATGGIDADVRNEYAYIDYSRYAYQAKPWIEVFGPQQFLAIDFHEYMADRPATTEAVEAFLGVAAGPQNRGTAIYNKGETTRTQLSPFWSTVAASRPYQWVRPRIPSTARRQLRNRLVPAPKERPRSPSQDTLKFLVDRLQGDIEEQPRVFGWASVAWSIEELQMRYLNSDGPP